MQLPNNNLEGVTNKYCRATSPTDYHYGCEIDTDTGYYMPTLISQPLAPPELLNDLVRFCEFYVTMPVFVRQIGNPVLKLAIVHELIEFVRISLLFFQLLQLKI